MKKVLPILLACLVVFVIAAVSSEKPKPAPQSAAAPASQLERGKYIVEGVGLCVDCHSPRDQRGQLIAERNLGGAPLAFKPAVEMPWGAIAPPLAGLEGYDEAELITFLSTGQYPDGRRPRPPMPEYRMTREDAAAVVAFLKSLKPVPPDGSLLPAGQTKVEKKP